MKPSLDLVHAIGYAYQMSASSSVANDASGMELGRLTPHFKKQDRFIVYKLANTSFAAATVSAISASVCAALMKPAS